MSFWNDRVWRSDKRFPPRIDTRPTVFTSPLFLAHYAVGFLLFGKIYRDAKRWRTRVCSCFFLLGAGSYLHSSSQTHTKAVIKEGERIHLHALHKKALLAENPGASIRVDTGNGTRELLEGDM
jgi:hypothetical protein